MSAPGPARDRHEMAIPGALALTALWTFGVCGPLLPPAAEQALSNIGQTAAAFAAGAAALFRCTRSTRSDVRRFWLLLGLGATAWGAGQASWSYTETFRGGALPFPSGADVGYLALPPLAVLALLSLPLAAPTRAGQLRSVLDGLLVAASLLLVSWITVLDPVFRAGADNSFAATVALAYPIADVVVITVVLYTTMTERRLTSDFRVPYNSSASVWLPYRVFVAELSAPVPGRHAEDRPELHQGHGGRSRRKSGPQHLAPRAVTRDGDRRRRDRTPPGRRPAPQSRLHERPGLLLLTRRTCCCDDPGFRARSSDHSGWLRTLR